MIRYGRVSYAEGETPEPLWVSDAGKPGPDDIPPCPHCNGPRTVEFQVQLCH